MNAIVRLVLVSVLLFQWTSVAAQMQAVPPNTADPEPQLPYSAKFVSYPAVLNDNALTVYEDVRGSGGTVRYAIPPYLYPKWGDFKKSVSDACKNRPENEVVQVYLSVQLASKAVAEQVVADLAKANVNITTTELHAYPTVMIVIRTGGSDGIPLVNRWIYPNITPDQINDKITVNITPHTKMEEVSIQDTCGQLVRIAQSPRNISGVYFSKNNTIKVNTLMASYAGFLHSEAFYDLLQAETQVGGKTITAKGTSGGIGLNFGGVFGGASNSKQVGEAVDNRRRVVTGNLIQEAAKEYSKVFSLTYRTEMAAEGFDEEAITKLLTRFVTSNAPKAEVEFNKVGDQWTATIDKLVSRAFAQSTVTDLLTSSGNPQLKGENFNSAAGSYGGSGASAAAPPAEGQSPAPAATGGGMSASGVSQQKAEFTDSRSIQWSRNDNSEWIPTKADLYYISENDLMSEVTAAYQRVIATPDSGFLITKMDVFYADGSVTPDMTILASTAPEKVVISIAGGPYKTEGIDSTGTVVETSVCPGQATNPPSGMTQIGAEDDGVENTGKCATTCSTNGLSCKTYLRKPGCYVSPKWFVWYAYQQQQSNAFVSLDEICAPPEVLGAIPSQPKLTPTPSTQSQLEKAAQKALEVLPTVVIPNPNPLPTIKNNEVTIPGPIKIKVKIPRL